MNVWVILYTYSGYDGEIDRLWENEDGYLVFSSKELAETYFSNRSLDKREFEIKEVSVIQSLA